jgi:hypothetical protein
MNDIQEMSTSFIADLGDSVRRNPLPAALIGMGALLLMSGRMGAVSAEVARRARLDRIPGAAGDALDSASSMVKSSVNSIGDRVTSAAGTVQDSAASAVDTATRFGREQAATVSQYARSVPGSASGLLDDARSGLAELFRTQPLALGAIGLAIGAGIAAALPATELESEYLGETSDAIRDKAREVAAEQVSRVGEAAETAINAAASEARKQGLTLDSAKSAAGDIKDKVGRVVEAAAKGAGERVAGG